MFLEAKIKAAKWEPRPCPPAVVLWAVTIGLLVWGLFQVAAIWRDRPVVMWDDRYRCWRAAPRYAPSQADTPPLGVQPIRPIRSKGLISAVRLPAFTVLQEVHGVTTRWRDRLACLAVAGPRVLAHRGHAHRRVPRALDDVPTRVVGIADRPTTDPLQRQVGRIHAVPTDLASRMVGPVRRRLGHGVDRTHGVVAQLEERRHGMAEVAGSIPADSTWGRLHASACTCSMKL